MGTAKGDTLIYVKKDDLIVLVTTNFHSDSPTNTVRNSGIVSCTQGEDIYLEGYYHGAVYGTPEIPYSTFTVFLMYTQTGTYTNHYNICPNLKLRNWLI